MITYDALSHTLEMGLELSPVLRTVIITAATHGRLFNPLYEIWGLLYTVLRVSRSVTMLTGSPTDSGGSGLICRPYVIPFREVLALEKEIPALPLFAPPEHTGDYPFTNR